MAFTVPAEFDLAAHARACRHGQGSSLDVAADHAAFQQLDPLRILDVAEELAAYADHTRLHQAFQMGTRVEGEIAVNVYVAFEATRDPHMTRTHNLALDRQIRGNDGFLHVEPLHFLDRAASRIGAEWGDIGLLRFTSVRRGTRVREVLRRRRAGLRGR